MKPNHKLTLACVACITAQGIALSYVANYAGSYWAFCCAGMMIFSAKDEDHVAEALELARQANDGWWRAIELNEKLLELINAPLKEDSEENERDANDDPRDREDREGGKYNNPKP
jgi:hypothetical protein